VGRQPFFQRNSGALTNFHLNAPLNASLFYHAVI
jgi:hypothetical protein